MKHGDKRHGKTSTPDPVAPRAGAGVGTADAHDAIIALGVLGAFVFGVTMFAGVSKGAGRVAVALMLALLLVQVMTHVNPVVKWAAAHPLIPGQTPISVDDGKTVKK